jgi:hypothetical protein
MAQPEITHFNTPLPLGLYYYYYCYYYYYYYYHH